MSSDLGFCLVTGASGFIGRTLVDVLLQRGERVRVLLRQPVPGFEGCESLYGELDSDPACAERAVSGIDTVFHLAGLAHVDAAEADHQRSAEAGRVLAQAAMRAGTRRFVLLSSTKAMGDPGNVQVDESFRALPTDPYGKWKRELEEYVLHEISIPHVAVLRACLVYGPGMKGNLMSMLKTIDRGYFPPLPAQCGARSMVSVMDVGHALVCLATNERANKGVFIAADNEAYTADRIEHDFRLGLGQSLPGWRMPRCLLVVAGMTGSCLGFFWPACPLSLDKVRKLLCPARYSSARLQSLGWKPQETFESVLPDIIRQYRGSL